MNGPSLQECAERLDDAALHEMVASMVAAAAACSLDEVVPMDLVEDLRWALTSGRLTNAGARACRLALKQLNGITGANFHG